MRAGLGEGVELHPHLAGAGGLEEAHRPVAVEGHLAVGAVVADSHVVAAGERHHPLEEVELGDGAGGVVGVVEPEQLRPTRHVRRHGVQVGQEAVLLAQGQVVGLAAGEERADAVHGVAGVRHQG
jgi:hypothetical protein